MTNGRGKRSGADGGVMARGGGIGDVSFGTIESVCNAGQVRGEGYIHTKVDRGPRYVTFR